VKDDRKDGLPLEGAVTGSETKGYYVGLPEIESLDEDVNVAILITSQSIGEEPLGRKLMESLLACFGEMPPVIRAVILMNEAVRLAAEGSPCVGLLETLQRQGTQVMCCSTSLSTLGVSQAVGTRAGILRIAETMLSAKKVITI